MINNYFNKNAAKKNNNRMEKFNFQKFQIQKQMEN